MIAAIYRAWQSGDLVGAIELLSPGIEWVTPPDAPDAGVAHGHEGVFQSLGQWYEQWGSLEIEDPELIDLGDRVLACTTQRGTGRASGIVVEAPLLMLWTLRAAAPVRMEMFTDERAALAAAGVESRPGTAP